MKSNPAVVWGGIIVGLLCFSLATQAVLLIASINDPSFAVESDYEWKANNWDALQEQKARSDALGWEVDLRATPSSDPGEVQLELSVNDRHGEPVSEALVEIEAFHNARAGLVLQSRLPAREAGVYGRTVTMRRSGIWEFRLSITRGEELFLAKIRKSVISVPRSVGWRP